MSHSMRTPLSRARGLGSAKDGVGHFIRQRVTAVALAILVPWFLLSLVFALQAGFAGATAWIGHPLNAVLLTVLLLTAFYHMRLGLQVVIEDYIPGHLPRAAALIANTFVCAVLAAASVLSVAKIFVGA